MFRIGRHMLKRLKYIIRYYFFISTLTVAPTAFAAELHVSVDGVRSQSGQLRIALFKSADTFATPDGRFREVVLPAEKGENTAIFLSVPMGTYGLAAFHDENGNGKFDKNFVGFPQEGFGFGNNASVFLGPPSFSEASVFIEDKPNSHSVTLRYW